MSVTSYTSLIDPIRERAATAPDWPGIVLLREDGGREVMTARELWAEALAVATGLRAAGIRPNDVVIVIMGHSRQLIATFLGAMAYGAVPTIVSTFTARLDPDLYRQRIEALVRNAAAKAVITHEKDPTGSRDLLTGLECPLVAGDELAGEADPGAVSPSSQERIAFIQYTSGSAGTQKGVVHTHGGVLRYIESKRLGVPFSPADVVVNWAPLYHDQGLVSGLLTPLVLGFRAVLMSPLQWVRNPGILLRAMHEYNGTVCYMPNFALNHSVRAVREQDMRGLDLSRLKLLLLGGEPVRVDSMRMFAERFAAAGFDESKFRAGYGMAEMVEGVTSSRSGPPNVDWIDVATLQRESRAVPVSPGSAGAVPFVSCGPPKHGAEMRIVDSAGAVLPERRVGEIEVRCNYRMREYHRRPEWTEAAFRDDWFRSGDLGYLVGGELYVVGRKSDRIIVGGHNISPEDIEAAAERVEGVLPGRSVAFGVNDDRAGTQRVVLVCERAQLDDDEQQLDLERRLRKATTQALEVTLGEVRFVERGWIVKTSSGKKARNSNRDKYLLEFGNVTQAARS